MADGFVESIGIAEQIKLKYDEGYQAGQNDLSVSTTGIRIPQYGSSAVMGQLLWSSSEFIGPRTAPVAHLTLLLYGHGYQSNMQTRMSTVSFNGAASISIKTGVYGESTPDYRISIRRNGIFYQAKLYAENNLSTSENLRPGSYIIIDQDPNP